MVVKLALIGDSHIRHYAVADRLWELLSVLTNTNLSYTTEPLATSKDVTAFFQVFKQDKSFQGFNIAIPWKGVLTQHVDTIENLIQLPQINTVYKDDAGRIVGVNTDPLAAQKAVESQANLYKCSSVLVIGALGVGLSIARHMADNLNKDVYIYDPTLGGAADQTEDAITYLHSLSDVATRTYDLIINATPLSPCVVSEQATAFAAPLDLALLSKVTHANTIVQETSYLPGNTLLLQMATHLGLQVVMGDRMLVFRAAESFKRFFNVTVDEPTIQMLIDEIGAYIAEREARLLEGGGS